MEDLFKTRERGLKIANIFRRPRYDIFSHMAIFPLPQGPTQSFTAMIEWLVCNLLNRGINGNFAVIHNFSKLVFTIEN